MLELLCLITNAKNDKNVKQLEKKYNLPFNLANLCYGTASSSVLEYFGLEEIKKYIYFSFIDSYKSKKILDDVKIKLRLDKPGKGIGFTIPISSSTKYIKEKIINSKEVIMDKKSCEYHLIITIVTEGFSEQVMNTAKKNGAGGGTLIRGRSLDQTNSKRQFLGFSIEPEKDVILIVAKNDLKNDIMNAIIENTGLKTKGGGIVFSLPITDVTGLYEQTN